MFEGSKNKRRIYFLPHHLLFQGSNFREKQKIILKHLLKTHVWGFRPTPYPISLYRNTSKDRQSERQFKTDKRGFKHIKSNAERLDKRLLGENEFASYLYLKFRFEKKNLVIKISFWKTLCSNGPLFSIVLKCSTSFEKNVLTASFEDAKH